MSNQKYTIEFKKQVVEFYLDHHTVKETLQEFQISESTLFAWKHQYQTRMFEKPRSTKSDSIKHMQRKLDRMKAVLEAQNILKCSPNASNAEKVKAVNSLKDRYSVRILCDAVNLPTGSYYHYKRREAYRTLYERNDELIKPFSRMVLSYAVSDRIDTMLTIETFSKAFRCREEPKSLMFHSDQEVQYTCHAFREFLKECSVTQSFATPGTPTENAVCEAFFSRMKYEALYRQTYSSIEEIDEEVSKYIDYYNNRRPHRRLNFKSPSEIEAAYYASLKT